MNDGELSHVRAKLEGLEKTCEVLRGGIEYERALRQNLQIKLEAAEKKLEASEAASAEWANRLLQTHTALIEAADKFRKRFAEVSRGFLSADALDMFDQYLRHLSEKLPFDPHQEYQRLREECYQQYHGKSASVDSGVEK